MQFVKLTKSTFNIESNNKPKIQMAGNSFQSHFHGASVTKNIVRPVVLNLGVANDSLGGC